MSMLLLLYWEFAKVGLFSIGGGLATIPFLSDLGARTGWFSPAELADMIAVSESTPGPVGVNMATYIGWRLCGPLGAVVSTLGLISPSVAVVIVIAAVLNRYKRSALAEDIFYGLRPASAALIATAGRTIAVMTLVAQDGAFRWDAAAIAVSVLVLTLAPRTRGLHPIIWIALSALIGIALEL